METGKIDVNVSTIIKYAIMFAIVGVFAIMPTIGPITRYGMVLIGIFISMIFAWSTIGMLIPSLIGTVMLAYAGYGTVQSTVIAMFSNFNVLLMIIGALAFSALAQCNATDWIFAKVLSSKLAQKSPVLTTAALLLVVMVLAILSMGIFIMFVLLPIYNDFLKKCGYTRGEKFCTWFLLGYTISYTLTISTFPFFNWGLMICGSFQGITGYVIPILPWIVANFVLYAIFIVVWPLLMKVVGCDFSKLENVDIVEAFNVNPDAKLNVQQKISLYGLIIFVAIAVLGSFVPSLRAGWAQLTITGLMLIYWIIMCLVKVDGKPILNVAKASGEAMNWDMVLLMAFALCLSGAMTGEGTGITTFMGMTIAPIVSALDPVMITIIVAIIMVALTNIANNIAVVYVMIGIMGPLYVGGVHFNMLAMSLILSVGSCMAYLTPASSVPGALYHGSAMIDPKKSMIPGLIGSLLGLVLVLIVALPITILGIGA